MGEWSNAGASIPYRSLAAPPDAEKLFDRFVGELSERLDSPELDRNDVCRDALAAIHGVDAASCRAGDAALPIGTRVLYASFDPRNVALKPEYFGDLDPARYHHVKPLTWLWTMFDRSPLGDNAFLGLRLRRALAERVFRHCGKNIKIWPHVTYTYGYNICAGDDVVLHQFAHLDDRSGITLGDHVSISEHAHIYSHSHDINDISHVYLEDTIIEDHARITYHATVLAGVRVGQDAMLGAMSLATKAVPGFHVSVGLPAKMAKAKERPCPHCVADAARMRSTEKVERG